MNAEFYKQIEQGTAHRKSRDENTAFVLSHPEYLDDLALIACHPKDKIHYKALWIMELISVKNTSFLTPIVDTFCSALTHYTIEKAIRPSAKICFQLVKSKAITLTAKQEKQIIETCLDWLITDVKVAPAAFAMRALFLLGKKHPWIHEELKLILSKTIPNPTPGYRFAVKDILKRLP
ncbi:hypothetical protein [Flavobacterium sp. N1994]|uniref:hypothetical protein n=1 Tax=Flavobacterium sp. N1994 TaxID=2986827 RepID=UPI00222320E6|nr:hypothetical protein [Flavobacterium sp. N1994]